MIRELVGIIGRSLTEETARRLEKSGIREAVYRARKGVAALINPNSTEDERAAARETLHALADDFARGLGRH